MSIPQKIEVLLVEDDPINAQLVVRMLTRPSGFHLFVSFQVTAVSQLSEALEQLQTSAPDVALLDLTLPDSHGIDTFKAVQTAAPHLPIILLSGLKDDQLLVQLFEQGAQDFLLKGNIKAAALAQAIINALLRHRYPPSLSRPSSHLPLRTQQIQQMADFDSLLGRFEALLAADEVAQSQFGWHQNLQMLAADLSAARTEPAVVVELYTQALQRSLQSEGGVARTDQYTVTGRMMLLEIIGHLAEAYYQQLAPTPAR